jgi:2,4-dienoyl-CoA reductase-like NADH-dependent reductase (Old Yellow Enzyme family)
LQELGCSLPVDNQVLSKDQGSPLGQSIAFGNKLLGNRWCIHPMEGWDANPDGTPSDRTMRRWSRFGESGAKLIWGGEAAAVQPDGRANPNQLLAVAGHESQLANLRNELIRSHQAAMSTSDDLIIGLQLTHSGRFARPHGKKLEPRIAYHHPLLDERFGIDPADDSVVWTDGELDALIERFVDAARVAEKAGFDFVDVKACHGYLLHEFLGAYHRPGRYGGDLNGRSRLLISTIEAVRQACPNLMIGVRLSAIDLPPYAMGSECGEPVRFDRCMPYEYGFGMNPSDPMTFDLAEPIELIKRLKAIGVVAVNVTFGSPYYTPHIQRPAIFPPSDGYLPPEDPLVGVHRHIETVARFKREVPDMILVGSGYTYLQDYLPHVAQAAVRQGMVDVVGLGRMVLSYPWLPADTLAGRPMARKFVCRTFSDCTSAPRNGMPSGCYPLDPFYKATPEAEVVRKLRNS